LRRAETVLPLKHRGGREDFTGKARDRERFLSVLF